MNFFMTHGYLDSTCANKLPYFFGHKKESFSLLGHFQDSSYKMDLDLWVHSFKMDLDFWDRFGKEKNI